MKARYPLCRLIPALLLLALLVGAASCAKKAAAGPPRAWIDSPHEGAPLPAGSPVPVVCRASAPKGLAEVLLSVNGTPYRSMPVAEAAGSCAVTIDWLPAGPGFYTLQVTALDTGGTESGPVTVIVEIKGETSEEPTEALAPTAETPPPEATATPTATVEEPTPTPTPTTKPSATPTVTPYPPPEVSFTVEQDTIDAGQCTILHWAVEHVTAVYLDGAGVVGSDSREVCPEETTTYTLHVEAPGGNVDVSVTVTVRPDVTPPPIPRLTSPGNGQTVTPSACPGKLTLDWSPVTDPSRVVYQVRMQWSDGPTWRDVGEWGPLEDSALKVGLDCRKAYRWSVRARDGAGNWSAWSAPFTFKVAGE